MIPYGEIPLRGASHHRRTGRPLVTLSYAQSLDGSIALHRDQPLALSCDKTLLMTHHLRASHNAILVGIGTVIADDPRLTARLVVGNRHPQPVIVDSHLRMPLNARLLGDPNRPPWIAVGESAEEQRIEQITSMGAHILRIPTEQQGWLDLSALLAQLGLMGVTTLMVEGGARIITSLLRNHLADWLVLTIAPVFVGGVRALDNSETLASITLPHIADATWEQMGHDMVVWGDLIWNDP